MPPYVTPQGRALLGGGVYAGPLDLVPPAAAAYAVARKLRSAYAGSAVRLRRDSDAAESDFGFTSAGVLDTAAVTAWLAGANGFIKTLYDQSGNGRDAIQTTTANQPAYVASAKNSRAGARFAAASSQRLATATFTSISQPLTALSVGKPGLDTGTSEILLGSALATYVASGKWTTAAGANLSYSGSAAAAYVIVTSVWNGASSIIGVNALEENGNAGANGTTQFWIGSSSGPASFLNGDFLESLIYPALLASDHRALLRANQNAFYAIY